MSTKTGFAPSRTIAAAVAKKVNGEVRTSSPGPTPSACMAQISASVPDDTAAACGAPMTAAISFSNASRWGPPMKMPERSTSSMAERSSSMIGSWSLFRSSCGTCIGDSVSLPFEPG